MLDFKLALEMEPELGLSVDPIILNLSGVPAFIVTETWILQAEHEIRQTSRGLVLQTAKCSLPLLTES